MSDSKNSKRTSAIPSAHQKPYSAAYIFFGITLSTGLLIAGTWTYLQNHHKLGYKLPKLTTPTDRLIYALQLQVFSLLPFFVSLQHVMMTRFTNPLCRNPLAGNEHLVERANRILVNTVEQTIFSFVNVTAFATLVPEKYLCLIPLLVFYFVFGRALFLLGYIGHPKHRVYGVVCTFFPSMAVFNYNLARVAGFV